MEHLFYISPEIKPFSQSGGIGDVAGELPWALQEQGLRITLVTPLYGTIKREPPACKLSETYLIPFHGRLERVESFSAELDGVAIRFLRNPTYFENGYGTPYVHSREIPFYDDALRFSFFSKACLPLIRDLQPDAVQANDWGLGPLMGWMARQGLPQKRIFTLHNAAYQGSIGQDAIPGWDLETMLGDEHLAPLLRDPRPEWSSINPLRLGLETAHRANTVSPTYCREITLPPDPERFFFGGQGLEETMARLFSEGRLTGILNGCRYREEPTREGLQGILHRKAAVKADLSRGFPHPEHMLLGFVGRAVEQKLRLLLEPLRGKSVLEHILDIPGVNLSVLASGLLEYERFLLALSDRTNFSLQLAFDPDLAEAISLGCDLFLMPSLFEPCGLTQMRSMSLATPPLVRWTGGLADTVRPHDLPDGTGFGFDGSSREALLENLIAAVREAVEMYFHGPQAFCELQSRGYWLRFTWSAAAQEYLSLYET